MSTVIRVENLSKKYLISHEEKEKYVALRDVITNSVKNMGNRLLHTFSGSNNKPKKEEFWALKEVSFEVKQGERIGIIGRNGAGKSTLLKLLSRITEPTEGRITLKGRVSSLLEVGTGFHPELTGRENIYLNGAILGMSRNEINRKFDEIVDFAEVDKFLDTPVKRYSSGMQVRLAFAVAAHLEPEILLVDEVLAVGDAAFQKKCLGKLEDVTQKGRTVIFVSHNMNAVSRLCNKVVLIEKGQIKEVGSSKEVVKLYLAINSHFNSHVELLNDSKKPMCLRTVTVVNDNYNPSSQFEMGKPIKIRIEYDINTPVTACHVICFLYNHEGINIFGTGDADLDHTRLERRDQGRYIGEFEIPPFLLGEGIYTLTVSLGIPFQVIYDRHEQIILFEVIDNHSSNSNYYLRKRPGILGLNLPWHYLKWAEK